MSFDRLAPHYRWLEAVLAGGKLQRCRNQWMTRLGTPARVLILGEGHGRFLLECRLRLPNARIVVIDASARMLAVARKRLERAGLHSLRTEFVHANALHWTPPPATFDLIVTHFFLDCFNPRELEVVIAKAASAATEKAEWLITDFQVPSGRLHRIRAQVILAVMYVFFTPVTRLNTRRLTPPEPLLRAHRFVLKERMTSEWGLLKSDLWQRESNADPRVAADETATIR